MFDPTKISLASKSENHHRESRIEIGNTYNIYMYCQESKHM